MLNDREMTRIEQKYGCKFIPSNIPGVNFMVSKDGWAILTDRGKRGITGGWESADMLAEELIGLKEVYGK